MLKEDKDYIIIRSDQINLEKIQRYITQNKLVLIQLTEEHEGDYIIKPNWKLQLKYEILEVIDCIFRTKYRQNYFLKQLGLFPSEKISLYSSQLPFSQFKKNMENIIKKGYLHQFWCPTNKERKC